MYVCMYVCLYIYIYIYIYIAWLRLLRLADPLEIPTSDASLGCGRMGSNTNGAAAKVVHFQ